MIPDKWGPLIKVFDNFYEEDFTKFKKSPYAKIREKIFSEISQEMIIKGKEKLKNVYKSTNVGDMLKYFSSPGAFRKNYGYYAKKIAKVATKKAGTTMICLVS